MKFRLLVACIVAALISFYALNKDSVDAPQTLADTIFVNGKIYTADKNRSHAQAMALKGDRLLFVGDDSGARSLIGDATQVVDLHGKRVLPGLHDTHIHPVAAMDIETCDLQAHPLSLEELSVFVAGCIEQFQYPQGEWVPVYSWMFTGGNEPGEGYASIREALDKASSNHPIILFGFDAHHMAVNSAALAMAKSTDGRRVGLSAVTLTTHFSSFTNFIGVDEAGEPNGRITELKASSLMEAPNLLTADLTRRLEHAEEIPKLLHAKGITSIMDAAVTEGIQAIYDRLLAESKLQFRATLAQFYH